MKNLTSTALRVIADTFPEGGLRRSTILTAAARLDRYEEALESIAESYPTTEEGAALAGIATDALKENN